MIETERLLLRPLRASDARDLLEYQSDPDVVRYTPWPVRDLSAVDASLAKIIGLHKDNPTSDGESIFLAWELKITGKVIGQSNMSIISSVSGLADIGWATHQSFQRQGYAREASAALLNHAYHSLEVRTVQAKIDTRNLASIHFAEQLGMSFVPEKTESIIAKDEECTILTYEITLNSGQS